MLVTSCVFLLMATNTDAVTTYHVALPGINPPTTATYDVALLHVSDQSASVSTANSSCLLTGSGTNDTILDQTCVGLLPSGVEMKQKGIKVTSDNAFDLHVLPMSADGEHWGDGYLAIPDEHLGDEYYILTYCTLGGRCQFSVVGTEDNTAVSITFKHSVDTVVACINGLQTTPSGTEIPFTLNEDDVLQIESEHDLSGTHITADKNIAVFAGASGLPFNTGSTYIFEQLPPVRKWMKDYVVLPNDLNDAGDIIKIVTMTDNTRVEITGYSPYVIPSKGMAIERRVDWRMWSTITASNPVSIVQVMSIDLYNDTTNVGGPPAMVLLQSESQWTEQGNLVCSNVATDTDSFLLSLVGRTVTVSDINNMVVRFAPEQIQGTAMDVTAVNKSGDFSSQAILSPTDPNIKYGFTSYCLYGSSSASAMLPAMDWTSDIEECVPTLSTPGDDIDNDCNGRIDEVNCTDADLDTNFTSIQQADGSTSQMTFGVPIPGYMKFHVKTTTVAEVVLWCQSDPTIHALFQIAEPQDTGHVVSGTSMTITTGQPIDGDYWVKWERQAPGTGNINITLGRGISMTSADMWLDSTEDCYNKITFHALTGSAEFTINAAKDCGKIVKDDVRDNHGYSFVLPVNSGAFTLYTASETTPTDFKIVTPDDLDTNLLPDSTYREEIDGNTLSSVNGHLILKSDVPVSAYLIKTGGTGFHLLPTDILGPEYHAVRIQEPNLDKCEVYSIDREINVQHDTSDGTVFEFSSSTFYGVDHLEGQQVMPVFCGDSNAILQMPPRETLGKKFYIPSVDFDFSATVSVTEAIIRVVTTEDSTYIKILGDYDQEDIEDVKFTSSYNREFVTNEKFTIETSKPVMVYVVFTIGLLDKIPVIIPPVDQYKTKTILPKFTGHTLLGSYAVDADGGDANTSIDTAKVGNEKQTLSFTKPTFFIAFLTDGLAPLYKVHIVTSDFKLEDINEMCTIADGNTLHVDDDCDGLVDEEVCYNITLTVITAGEVDYDVDGAVMEDCISVSDLVTPSYTLDISAQTVTCNSGSTSTGTIPPPTTLVPPTPMPPGLGPISNVTEPAVPIEVVPVYDPEENMTTTASIVPFGVEPSDPNLNSTAAPVKLCRCVCPCGWVTPANMTETELKAKVEEIQEKLKLEKKQLSAFVRKKTSAKDDRPSATAVGSAGVTFLVITLTAVFLLDLASLIRDLRLLRENLRQAFEM